MAWFSLPFKFKNDLVFVKSAKSAVINFKASCFSKSSYSFCFCISFFEERKTNRGERDNNLNEYMKKCTFLKT